VNKVKNVTFGSWLRWQIARKRVSPAELAAYLDVSRATISNLFNRAEPGRTSDETITKLAELFEMDEPELLVAWKDGLPSRGKAKRKGR
jgi:plasmid maintenance system antidote protein VapI